MIRKIICSILLGLLYLVEWLSNKFKNGIMYLIQFISGEKF